MATLVLHGENDSSVAASCTRSLEVESINKNISWVYGKGGHSLSSYTADDFEIIQNFLNN